MEQIVSGWDFTGIPVVEFLALFNSNACMDESRAHIGEDIAGHVFTSLATMCVENKDYLYVFSLGGIPLGESSLRAEIHRVH